MMKHDETLAAKLADLDRREARTLAGMAATKSSAVRKVGKLCLAQIAKDRATLLAGGHVPSILEGFLGKAN
jgi:hypothetical protein